MSVVITNVSTHDDLAGPNEYVIQFSGKPVVARFTHVRSEGLAVCLRCAAEAVDAALITPPGWPSNRERLEQVEADRVATAERSSIPGMVSHRSNGFVYSDAIRDARDRRRVR